MGEGSTAAAIGTMTLGTILLIVAGVALIAGLLDYRLTTKAVPRLQSRTYRPGA